jgi:hypothetical protein
MIVEVNIDTLLEKKLSPSQYTALCLLYNRQLTSLGALLDAFPNVREELIALEGYFLDRSGNDFVLNRSKVMELFDASEKDLFWEFFSTYPIKVPAVRGKGSWRPLRPSSPDAKLTQACKVKYDSIVNNRQEVHKNIMKCLIAELNERKKANSMSFMQELTVYLNQRTWEKYESIADENETLTTEDNQRYGEGLI